MQKVGRAADRPEIDARRAYELANAANQARGNPMLPYCAHCNAVPLTERFARRDAGGPLALPRT